MAMEVRSSLNTLSLLLKEKCERGEDFADLVESVLLVIQSEENVDVTQLAEIIDILHRRIDNLEHENVGLKKDIIELKSRLAILEGNRKKLIRGQIAVKFERTMIIEITKGCRVDANYFSSLGNLEKAIKGVESYSLPELTYDDRKLAKTQWMKLDEKYQITQEDYAAMKCAKKIRTFVAHPEMDLQEARKMVLKDKSNYQAHFLKSVDILQKLKISDSLIDVLF